MGAEEYVRNVLTNALGQDKAAGIIDRILLGEPVESVNTGTVSL